MAPDLSADKNETRLGAGAFGTVFKFYHQSSGSYRARKEVDLDENMDIDRDVMREVNALERLNHEHVVKYFGYKIKKGDRGPGSRKLCIYMEYAVGGSVKDRLKLKEGGFNETQAKEYTRQMLEGVSYLHKKGIIHRDLKCANMLLDGKDNIKLADFGIAIENYNSTYGSEKTQGCGTMYFMAPEVMTGREYDRKADIWSAGATLVEMLTTHPPWYELNDNQLILKINQKSRPEYVLGSSLGPEVRKFLDEIFNYNSERRPSAEELLKHDWLKTGKGPRYRQNVKHSPGLSLTQKVVLGVVVPACIGLVGIAAKALI